MIQLRRSYTNGESTSHIITDLIDKEVKINGLGFENIKLVPCDEALNLNDIEELSDIMWKRPKKEFDEHEWLSAIEQTVESEWDPSKFNLVMHSSGYDSRVISHFLTKVHSRKPGSILFACIEPEVDEFMKIMNYQGWEKHQLATYDKLSDPYKLIFKFSTAYKGLDGTAEFPVNIFEVCIKYLQRIRKLPKDLNDVVLWSGIHMNELFRSVKPLAPSLKVSYSHRITPILGITLPTIVAPVVSIPSLRAIFSKSRNVNWKWREFSVRELDPKLAEFPKLRSPTGLDIPSDVVGRMVNDFKSSYYYKHVNQIPIPEITHTHFPEGNKGFWRVWTFASLVEHLVKNKVKIL